MKENMKKTYRMFKRNDRKGVYYIQKNGENTARSLHTTDETEAQRLLDTENQAAQQPASLNMQLGKPPYENPFQPAVAMTRRALVLEPAESFFSLQYRPCPVPSADLEQRYHLSTIV